MAEDKKDKEMKVYWPFEDKDQRPLLLKIIDRILGENEKGYNVGNEIKKGKTT